MSPVLGNELQDSSPTGSLTLTQSSICQAGCWSNLGLSTSLLPSSGWWKSGICFSRVLSVYLARLCQIFGFCLGLVNSDFQQEKWVLSIGQRSFIRRQNSLLQTLCSRGLLAHHAAAWLAVAFGLAWPAHVGHFCLLS